MPTYMPSQIKFNPLHHFSRDLRCAWLVQDGAYKDVFGVRNGMLKNNVPIVIHPQLGSMMWFNNNTANIVDFPTFAGFGREFATGGKWTFSVWFTHSDTQNAYICADYSDNTGNSATCSMSIFYYTVPSSMNVRILSGGSFVDMSVTPATVVNQLYNITVTAHDTAILAYINGRLYGNQITAMNLGTEFTLGRPGNYTTDQGWRGLIGPAVVWGRTLTPEEIRAYYIDPWAMFRAVYRPQFFTEAPAPPATRRVFVITS